MTMWQGYQGILIWDRRYRLHGAWGSGGMLPRENLVWQNQDKSVALLV